MADETRTITGGCMCGAVRYEADGPPRRSFYCHCRMCQHASGSAFTVSVLFRKDAFRFTRGAAKFYKSSDIAERGFCAECGSRLVYRPFEANFIVVETGSLDHPENAAPRAHWGVESQLPWLKIDDGLSRGRTDEYPDFDEL